MAVDFQNTCPLRNIFNGHDPGARADHMVLSLIHICVTYGAGGGTSQNTIDIASFIQKECGTAALAHLSCVSSSRAEVAQLIEELRAKGIQNVLALRGDIPVSYTHLDVYKRQLPRYRRGSHGMRK